MSKLISHSESAEPVKVAVVGLGFMGMTHLRAYLGHGLARVVAVCDASRAPVGGRLAGVAGNITQPDAISLGPEVKVFRDLQELLVGVEVDLVDLCTPTRLHEEQTVAALKAGKHVLCEKPLAHDLAAARRVLRVAAEAPGFLMPAMCMRFWPGWGWLRRVVSEQTYGGILAASFRRLSAMPAWGGQGTYAAHASHGGALLDLHIHDTDFVNFLFGPPESVHSSGVIGAGGTVTHVMTQYRYPNGPVVHAEGSWLLARGFHMGYTLHCERATLDFDLARGADAMQVTESGQPPRTLRFEGPDGYGAEIDYMLRCVAERQAPRIVTGQDGVAALAICAAEEESVRSGRIIRLPSEQSNPAS